MNDVVVMEILETSNDLSELQEQSESEAFVIEFFNTVPVSK